MHFKLLVAALLTSVYSCLSAQQQEDQDTLMSIALKMDDWTYKNIDSSRYYACELMNEAILRNDTTFLAQAYTGLAYTYFYERNLKQALHYLHASNFIINDIGDSLDIADSYMNFGNVYTEMGLYEQGIDYYKTAEKYIPPGSKWFSFNLAYLYYNIAQSFLDLEDLKDAREYIAKSETNALKDSVNELLYAIKNLSAELLLYDGKNEEARKYAQLALLQAVEFGDLIEQAKSLQILAELQSLQGNHTKAVELQQQALQKSTEFGDPVDIAGQYVQLSSVLLKSGKPKEALEYALKAQKQAENVHSQLLYKETTKVLAEAYEANNMNQLALDAYKRHYAYSDSIAKVNISERMLLNQNKIQTQRAELLNAKNAFQRQIIKQNKIAMIVIGAALLLSLILMFNLVRSLRKKRHSQQIIEEKQKLLNLKTEELNDKNEALKELNSSKDKLFSILSHDLKQPFNQTLQLLEILELQLARDRELHDLTNQVKQTVEDTKSTVEHLLTWSKSQFTHLKTEASPVNLKSLSDLLNNELKGAIVQKNIDCQVSVPEDLAVLSDPNHLEIILRNLLHNAIKFSNPGGIVELNAHQQNGSVVIEVKDYGQGMDKKQLKMLFDINANFSTPGTLNEKGTGLGMLIVNDFIKENNGQLEVESKPHEGSTFRIFLPPA